MTTFEAVLLAIATFTGVASLGWQIFSHLKDGPKLRIAISQGMKRARPLTPDQDKLLTVVNVVNAGTQATVLTHLIFALHRSRYCRLLRRKPLQEGLIPLTDPMPLPHKLGVSDQWMSLIDQTDVDQLFEEGNCLYIGVHHTFKRRAAMVRVERREDSAKDAESHADQGR